MTKDESKTCCICGSEFTGWGNNPEPFEGETACNECNDSFVVPTRMCLGRGFQDQNILSLLQTIAELGKCMRNAHSASWAEALIDAQGRSTDGQKSPQES